jgi:uncharacterized membrane protein YqiK
MSTNPTSQIPQSDANAESIWAILRETAQLQKEYELQRAKAQADSAKAQAEREQQRIKAQAEYEQQQIKAAAERAKAQAEYDARWERAKAESDRQLAELKALQAKNERAIADLGKNIGGLNNRIGEIMETLIAARLWEKFGAYPYGFKRAYQRVGIYDGDNRLTDVDILLSNGEYAMAVEVKNTLNSRYDVDDHVKRIEKLMKFPPAEVKGKTVLGAMACGVLDPEVRDYAFGKGFFVLDLTGDTVALASPPSDFVPREWNSSC